MRQQPKWLRALGNTRDGVFVVNGAQRIILWNKGARRILGYPEADVLNKKCYQVVAGNHCDKAWCHANCLVQRQVLRGTLPGDFDLLTQPKRGKAIWVNVSIIALPRKDKPLTVHLLRDVTQQKRNEEKLQKVLTAIGANHVSKEKRKAKGGVTHSSYPRQPLSALSRREMEVLAMLAEGLSGTAIALRLSVSRFTVRSHIQNALAKLGLHNKAEAIAYAFRNGLL